MGGEYSEEIRFVMTYFLDSNICIYHLNDSEPRVSERLERTPTEDIRIPSVVAAELLYGAEKSAKREHNLKAVRSFLSLYKTAFFDGKSAEHYAVIRAGLERAGKPIGGNDMMIAATALVRGGILVTHNIDEFSRIEGLLSEDWTTG
jgi:tRNA(fMet)-specific endonuclease VapC